MCTGRHFSLRHIELSETIKRLNNELQSAHTEIEHLNEENIRLKTDLGESYKVIEMYKKVQYLDAKITTPKSTRKHRTQTKLESIGHSHSQPASSRKDPILNYCSRKWNFNGINQPSTAGY